MSAFCHPLPASTASNQSEFAPGYANQAIQCHKPFIRTAPLSALVMLQSFPSGLADASDVGFVRGLGVAVRTRSMLDRPFFE